MHWILKFKNAIIGLHSGVRGQSSFYVHIPATFAVPLVAYALGCPLWQWCALGLCVGLVWALELFNSAIEYLAHGLCKEQNAEIGRALDTASAAVLVGALTAICIGLSIVLSQLISIIRS